jgi:hypothetical protein
MPKRLQQSFDFHIGAGKVPEQNVLHSVLLQLGDELFVSPALLQKTSTTAKNSK